MKEVQFQLESSSIEDDSAIIQIKSTLFNAKIIVLLSFDLCIDNEFSTFNKNLLKLVVLNFLILNKTVKFGVCKKKNLKN